MKVIDYLFFRHHYYLLVRVLLSYDDWIIHVIVEHVSWNYLYDLSLRKLIHAIFNQNSKIKDFAWLFDIRFYFQRSCESKRSHIKLSRPFYNKLLKDIKLTVIIDFELSFVALTVEEFIFVSFDTNNLLLSLVTYSLYENIFI